MTTTRLATLLATIALTLASALPARPADPTATRHTAIECQGSAMPYPTNVTQTATPDSLEAVMINHVGRHGSRYMSSNRHLSLLIDALERADAQGTITPKGRQLKALCNHIVAVTAGQWGSLDSLGVAEMRAIASRMFQAHSSLFNGGRVEAWSSYSPRCIMSMYTFAHQLSRLNNKIEVLTSSGRRNSDVLRPFDTDVDYRDYRAANTLASPYNSLREQLLTPDPLLRVLGNNFSFADADEVWTLAEAQFTVLAATAAIGLPCSLPDYFNPEEYNAFWAVDNLKHYLQYSASTLTASTADMAAPLLLDLIETTEAAAQGVSRCNVMLRFAHAETLMPLLALMHLPGCYYMTNYFDTVALHWRDFNVTPMGANLQLILFRHKESGRLYLRADLNETPVALLPGRDDIYVPWSQARDYLTRCLPLIMQP